MFFFAGVYEDLAAAEGDRDLMKAMHQADDFGAYDAAIVTKHGDGELKASEAWVASAVIAEAGTLLDGHAAALIVVGVEGDGVRLARLTAAKRHTLAHVQGDYEEAGRQGVAALRQAV